MLGFCVPIPGSAPTGLRVGQDVVGSPPVMRLGLEVGLPDGG